MITNFNVVHFVISLMIILGPLRCKTYELNDPPPLCSAYEMLIVNTQQCVSRCPIRCVDRLCFEDGECPCANSYMASYERGLICAQTCLPGCLEAGGYCASAEICICKHKGSYFEPVSRKCRKHSLFKDKCRGRCNHGYCNGDGVCTCATGFNYTESLLGQLCVPQCKQNCGSRGYCFLPNMCACRKRHEHYGSDGKCYHDDQDYVF